MKIAVPLESDPVETRVAATPDTVKRFVGLGADVVVQTRAGELSRLPDANYAEAGATIVESAGEALGDADIVLKVRRPNAEEIGAMKEGTLVVATMDPFGNEGDVKAMADAGLTAVSMEFMPRITRAQVMDVLSSQANLAGYQAVVDAGVLFDRALPMMMTAAGTVPAAKIFVMGAGVAGLQAIATARRIGAVVSATDVRPAAKEQVESLGGEVRRGRGRGVQTGRDRGWLRQGNVGRLQEEAGRTGRQHIAKQDIVITTALIPGRPAPRLVSKEMLEAMKPGSVVIDLAVERGGNVEGASAGEVVTVERRQDRRLSQRAGPDRGHRVAALRQEPLRLCRNIDRQGRKEACHRLGRRTRQGDRADPRRRHRPSGFRRSRGEREWLI